MPAVQLFFSLRKAENLTARIKRIKSYFLMQFLLEIFAYKIKCTSLTRWRICDAVMILNRVLSYFAILILQAIVYFSDDDMRICILRNVLHFSVLSVPWNNIMLLKCLALSSSALIKKKHFVVVFTIIIFLILAKLLLNTTDILLYLKLHDSF